MKTYIGTKTVQARPMTRGEAEALLGRQLGDDSTTLESPGYLVRYDTGYQAWSPSDPFERAYREVPTDYRQRVRDERDGVAANLGKLTEFLGGDVFAKLPEDEKGRLLRQAKIMRELCDVLGERIAAFDQQDVLAVPAVLKVPADEAQTEADIQAKGLTAPRVTPEHINKLMSRVVILFSGPSSTTSTFAHAFLDGVFFLATGHSACVSPENFDQEVGMKIARANAERAARDKLWELEGYALYRSLNPS